MKWHVTESSGPMFDFLDVSDCETVITVEISDRASPISPEGKALAEQLCALLNEVDRRCWPKESGGE